MSSTTDRLKAEALRLAARLIAILTDHTSGLHTMKHMTDFAPLHDALVNAGKCAAREAARSFLSSLPGGFDPTNPAHTKAAADHLRNTLGASVEDVCLMAIPESFLRQIASGQIAPDQIRVELVRQKIADSADTLSDDTIAAILRTAVAFSASPANACRRPGCTGERDRPAHSILCHACRAAGWTTDGKTWKQMACPGTVQSGQ